MPRKKIGYVERVDELTGEITKSVSWYSNKFTESFVMLRTTDGLDWFLRLSKNEKSLIVLMHNWADPKTGRISLQGWQREEVCIKLGINRRNISVILHSLCVLDCLVRISQNDFMVNPAHMFKCSANEVRERIEKYKSLK